MDWLEITLIGLMAGTMGTGIGGLLALSLLRPSNSVLGLMLGFSGGIMLSIVFMELLQEAAKNSFAHMIVGLLLGILVFVYLDNYFPHWHYVSEETVGKAYVRNYVRKGVLIATGIALHNLPEGIAIGAGFASSEQMGITLAILIAAHNIPEGMAVGFPLYIGGLGRAKSLAITLMAGVPMGAGALLGALTGNISLSFLSLSLGFAAGAMLYIVCDELIPDVYRLASAHTAILGITAGILTGMLMVYYL